MACRFEKVIPYKDIDFPLPQRKTAKSAGYDFVAVEEVRVPSIYGNIFKLLIQRYSELNFIEKLKSKKLYNLIKNQKLDKPEEIQEAILETLPLILSHRIIKLDQMKEYVKESLTKLTLIPTGVKVYLKDYQVLELSMRSSIPMNNYIMLGNGVGVIDADYVDNADNEGHIFFQVINFSPYDLIIQKGDVIGQGVIKKYYTVDDDSPGGTRVGGFGSTSI